MVNELGGWEWGNPSLAVCHLHHSNPLPLFLYPGPSQKRVMAVHPGPVAFLLPADHQEIHRFLHALRSILRGHNAAAIITLPASLAKSLGDEEVKRLSWAVDACVELKGFAGRSKPFTDHTNH